MLITITAATTTMAGGPMFPHELVTDPAYFENVLRNMEWVVIVANRRACFGTTGGGVGPNYQTGWADDVYQGPDHLMWRRFGGRTHKLYHHDPLAAFNDANLTPPYTWDEVVTMLQRCTDMKAG